MFGTVNARMKYPKNFLTCYLLFLCTLFNRSQAQILGTHTQFAPNADRTNRLSPQQQGQILSDIQQHQHRFDLSQNRQNFEPQHFQANQNLQQAQRFQQFLNQQQFVSQSPVQLSTQENFAQNEFLSSLPLLKSIPSNVVPTPQHTFQQISAPTVQTPSSQVVFPNQQPTDSAKILQHHTQTNFQPARQHISFGPQFIQPRPTSDPLALIDQQIKLLDPEKHKQKIKELKEKQGIIEKHNQFVEKQYDKALKKAQEDHQEFIDRQRNQKKQLYQRLYKTTGSEPIHLAQSAPRFLYPEEVGLFEQAVKQYYNEHPTTTTTTTTTPKPTTPKKVSLSIKAPSFLPTALPQSKLKTIQSLEDLDQLQKEYKSQRIRKDDLLEQLKLAIGRGQEDEIGKALSSREISLSNGKKIQFISADDRTKLPKGKEEEITLPDGKKVTVIRADDPNNKSDEEVVLPSGHQVQIIRTTDPNSIAKGISGIPQEITLPNGQKAHLLKTTGSGANEPPPIEEIELPNGERVELIKTSDPNLVPDGVKVEPGSDLEKLVFSRTTTTIKPPKAILDELTKSVSSSNYELLKTGASGGLESIGKNLPNQKKVTFVLLEEQSDGTLKVQGVKGNDKDKTVDVDAILNKIKRGEIKLPDSPSFSTTTTKKPEVISTTLKSNFSPTLRPIHATITPNSFATDEANRYRSTVSYDTEEEEESEVPALQTNIGTQIVSSSTPATYYSSSSTTSRTTKKASRTPHILNNAADLLQASSIQTAPSKNLLAPKPTEVTVEQSITPTNLFPIQETFSSVESPRSSVELPDIMKKNGLFAMAKFLKQSGLDTILNETGPYTVFVPTDKAFRTLLIQLGGPERAEEKFKDNPRLLSGLLLHHVIPGAFKISSLQDEMTGVSLAGTQLRVNQYTMHDKEWNDVKITTINGAKVLEESQDIDIPQGVAHAVDRVMFPLPVGDIVQTLQSDRERRFTSFLRAIFASGLDEMLQGSKIFTLIAPTEKAFAGLSVEDLSKLVTDKVLARELVLRHLVAGTLYTNGMRYYQIKDSLLQDRQLTFSKQSGKVKVNNNLLTTQNIPATNGVIHAVDTLL